MIKVPITYKNFDDVEVTEEHYFHLSKAELIEMIQTSDGEDIVAKLERVGKSNDGALIMMTFKEIIGSAYGQRVDGNASQFYKNEDLTQRFLGSLAFDQLLMDLVTNTVSAAAFINGLLPSGLDKLAEVAAGARATKADPVPAGDYAIEASGLKHPMASNNQPLPWAFREPTDLELTQMTKPQLLDAMRRKSSDWKPPVSA